MLNHFWKSGKLIWTVLLLLSFYLHAQSQNLTVSPSGTAGDLAEQLLPGSNSGITITDATFGGSASSSSGTFSLSGGGTLGLSSGIILSTGNISGAAGPKSLTEGGTIQGTGGDSYLSGVVHAPTFDASSLEFKFVAIGNKVTFRYVFASDEYKDFTCSNLNDAFAFLVSGPGITGVKNIALIPSTSTPVSINTVNSGTPGTWGNSANCPNVATAYYRGDAANGSAVNFAGYTVVLTAELTVQPCAQYHIRIVVADTKDSEFDSAVLLEAGSMSITQPLVTISGATGNVICSNSPATLTAPTGYYSYQWKKNNTDIPGATSSTYSADAAGTYKVVVQPVSCNATKFTSNEISLTVQTAPSNIISRSTSSLCGTGNINLTAADLGTGGTYSWSTGATTRTINVSAAGNYQVTLHKDACTVVSELVSITGNTLLAGASKTDVYCHGGSDGTITLSPEQGLAPYTVDWEHIASGPESLSLTGLAAGTYVAHLTDGNGCTKVENVTINQPAELAIDEVVSTGVGSASIDFASAGTPPYTVVWKNSLNETIATLTTSPYTVSSLASGNYTVYVTDANGCTDSDGYTESGGCSFTAGIDEGSTHNVSCPGLSDGAISITVASGNSPYTYQWKKNGVNYASGTLDLSGIGVGNYLLEIIDEDGCKAYTSRNITAPSFSLNATGTGIGCNGDGDGSVNAGASGGAAPLTYSWKNLADNSPVGSTAIVINLEEGSYEVTVTDNNGCVLKDTAGVGEPGGLSFYVTKQVITCHDANNGVLDVVITGGTAPYVISWTGTGGFTSSAPHLSGLSAGTYTVTVSDAHGCTSTVSSGSATVVLNNPAALSLNIVKSTTVRGQADLTVTGGRVPYSYLWSNGFTYEDPSNLQEGQTYSVTVTDSSGCTKTASVTMGSEGCHLAVQPVSQQHVSCYGGGNGSVVVAIASGSGKSPYTFEWKNSGGAVISSVQNPTGLAAGTYTVKATDSTGCQSSLNVTLNQPDSFHVQAAITSVACHDQSNGAIALTVSGSTSPYTYNWSGPLAYNSTNKNITDLAGGNYTLIVTDFKGCKDTTVHTVVNPAALSASGTPTPVSCYGEHNGSIQLTASGGWLPYTYNWSGPSGYTSTAEAPEGLHPGIYTVTVKDARNCTASASDTITQPSAALLAVFDSQTNIACHGASTGSITAHATGGTTAYTYAWTQFGDTLGTSASISSLKAGDYIFWVKDARNCVDSLKVTLTEPPAPPVIAVNGVASGCKDVTPVTIYTHSVAGATYEWFARSGTSLVPVSPADTDTSYSPTVGGRYVIKVNKGSGCIESSEEFLVTLDLPPVTTIQLNPDRKDFCAGQSFTLTSSYAAKSYEWKRNGTLIPSSSALRTITATESGIYTLVAKNRNCDSEQERDTITYHNLFSFTKSFSNVSCVEGHNGSAAVSVSGAFGTKSYQWKNTTTQSVVSTDSSATGLTAGTYSIRITDAAGCTDTSSVVITQPTFVVTPVITAVSCHGGSNGSIALTVSSSVGSCSLLWSTGSMSTTISSLPAGTYTAAITCGSGCDAVSRSFTVTAPDSFTVSLTPTSPACHGQSNGSVTANVSGGTAPYTYLWTNAQTGATATSLAAGTYNVTVTDSKSCTVTGSPLSLTQPSALSVTVNKVNPSCTQREDGILTTSVTGGTAPYSYAWSTGATANGIAGVGAGTYNVTVTDSKGCTAPGSNTLTAGDDCPCNLSLSLTAVAPYCVGGNDGSITVNLSGGQAPYRYDWSHITGSNDGASAGNVSGNVTYTLKVYDSSEEECVISRPVFVPAGTASPCLPPPCSLSVAAAVTHVSCYGLNNGAVNLTPSGGAAPYNVDWKHIADTNNTEDLSGLAPGTYVAVVSDTTKRCFYTVTAIVREAPRVGVHVNNRNLCPGELATLTSSSPAGNSWSTGATTRSITVGVGTYVLTVDGCSTARDTVQVLARTDCEKKDILCDPEQFPTYPVQDSCARQQINRAIANAQMRYQVYMEDARTAFRQQYIAKCLSAYEDFRVDYTDREHHYTLYYYDQGGNLVRTVPPGGVVQMDSNAMDSVRVDRFKGTRTVFTHHTLATTYTYNSLGQLTAQNMPDHRTMNLHGEKSLSGEGSGLAEGLTITSTQFTGGGEGILTAYDGSGQGYIYTTDNEGKTWNRLSRIGTQDLYDIQVLDGSKAYVIGEDGVFFKSADAGLTWTLVPTGLNADLKWMKFSDANHGVVYDKTGMQYVTADGAETWTDGPAALQSLAVGRELTDIYYSAAGVAYATLKNGNKGYIYKTINNGTTWTQELNIRPSELSAVHMYKSNAAMAITRTGMLASSDNSGSTWQLVPGRLPGSGAKMIWFQSETLGMALAGDEKVYYTNDGGKSWIPTALTGVTDIEIRKTDNVGYAVTAAHKLYKTSNGGINWAEITGLPAEITGALTAVSSMGTENIYIVEAGSPSKVYARQRREGTFSYTWAQLPGTGLLSGSTVIKDIHFSTDGLGFDNKAVLLYSNGEMYKTEHAQKTIADTDAPTTLWESMPSTEAGAKLQFNSTDVGYRITDLKVEKTDDAGFTWSTLQDNSGVFAGPILSMSVFSDTKAVAAVNGGRLYTYNGSWTETGASSIAPSLEAITMDATAGGYAVGLSGTVIRYTSSGWQVQETEVQATKTLYAVTMKPATGSVVVAVGAEGSVLYTANSGVQWNTTSGGSRTFTAVAAYGDQYYAAGQGGTNYRAAESNLHVFFPVASSSVADVYTLAFKDGQALSAGAKGKIFVLSSGAWSCVTDEEPKKMLASSMGDKNTGYAVGSNGTVLKSTDGGKKWTEINSVTNKTIRAVDFIDAEHGIIAGDNGLLKYTDVGGTDKFKNATISGASGVEFRSVQMVTSKIAVVVGEQTSTGAAKAYVSKDGGHSWTAVSSTLHATKGLNAVHFPDESFGFAVGEGGLMYRIIPGGSTYNWQLKDFTGTPPVDDNHLLSVHCIDRVTIYVGSTGGKVFKTVNSSDSWTDVTGGSSGDVLSINFTDRTTGFIAGTNTKLDKLDDEKDLYSGKFWYDQLGRLILSQNAKQCNEDEDTARYSYTLYDELGRISEVGELRTLADIKDYSTTGNAGQLIEARRAAFVDSSAIDKRQVTRTYYDVAPFSVPGLQQERLRTRVASVTYSEKDKGAQDYDHATHYTYDIHGNVKTIVQDYRQMAQVRPGLSGQRYKRIDYTYDLVSGNVNEVAYQKGEKDQYYHRYQYDADNRITQVETSANGVLWDKDAKYFYYDHGPLARTETGDLKVQGTDYAYTIQGWIKGVNNETLTASRDQGKDGHTSGSNQYIAQDAYGYSLSYFNKDYKAVGGTSAETFMASISGNQTNLNTSSPGLYNGNIRRMTTAITNPNTGDALPQMTAYRYDQLNRIKQLKAYSNINVSTNAWNSELSNNAAYEEQYTYDANGNIETLKRNGASGELAMDNLRYHYEKIANTEPGANYKKNTNKLRWVDDSVTPTSTYDDINDQELNNYEYDDIGNLIKDDKEHIDTIIWTVYGKVGHVIKESGYDDLEFLYDATGNRIAKIVKPHATKADTVTWKTTWYMRDASGNVMATYDHHVQSSTDKFTHKEQMLYGSSRLGMDTIGHELLSYDPQDTVFRMLGKKHFEGTNHLGNVLTVISDRRIAYDAESQNIVPNGTFESHASGLGTSWSWLNNSYEGTGTIVTGNGFTGNAQRIDNTPDLRAILRHLFATTPGKQYRLTFKHRSNKGFRIIGNTAAGTWYQDLESHTGTAQEVSYIVTTNSNSAGIYLDLNKVAGAWMEIDDISLTLYSPDATVDYYRPHVITATDYYAFGMAMPGRTFYAPEYRYGFNGKEKDDEISSGDYDFGARIYDSRLGRWLAVDPFANKYPGQSPYNFALNNPMAFIDPGGDTVTIYLSIKPVGTTMMNLFSADEVKKGAIQRQVEVPVYEVKVRNQTGTEATFYFTRDAFRGDKDNPDVAPENVTFDVIHNNDKFLGDVRSRWGGTNNVLELKPLNGDDREVGVRALKAGTEKTRYYVQFHLKGASDGCFLCVGSDQFEKVSEGVEIDESFLKKNSAQTQANFMKTIKTFQEIDEWAGYDDAIIIQVEKDTWYNRYKHEQKAEDPDPDTTGSGSAIGGKSSEEARKSKNESVDPRER